MKRLLAVLALLILALPIAGTRVSASGNEFAVDRAAVWSGDTTWDWLLAADAEARRAEGVMTEMLARIRQAYSNDPRFLSKLDEAQRAWLVFREAHLESVFPGEDKQRDYGTMYGPCSLVEWASLTWERVKQLNLWLEGVPEGTLGAGSRRFSPPSSLDDAAEPDPTP